MINEREYLEQYRNRSTIARFEDTMRFPFLVTPEQWITTYERLPEPFTIGIPKSKGEFANGISNWLYTYQFDRDSYQARVLTQSNEYGSHVFWLRTADVIKAVATGRLKYGLLGADKIREYQLTYPIVPIQPLCFGACYFCLGFPNEQYPRFANPTEYVQYLQEQCKSGKSIATSLPNVLKQTLINLGCIVEDDNITYLEGSVEVAPKIFPDVFAIADVVDTGNTSFANGIRADLKLIQFPGAYIITSYEN